MAASKIHLHLDTSTRHQTQALATSLGKSISTLITNVLTLFLENSKGRSIEEIAGLLEHNSRESLYSAWWYRELTDNAPVMIWASGLDKRFTFVNKAWLDFSGKPLRSLLGDGWLKDLHPDDIERYLTVYDTAFAIRDCFDIEMQLRNHQGEFRWLINTAAPHYNSNCEFIGFVGSCIDITPRMQLEKSLSLAATSAGVIDDGVIMTNPDHTITWINPAFTNITGYTLEEVKGKKPSLLSSGKHNPEFYAYMNDKLSEGKRWQGEIWNRRKNGEVYLEWLSINSVQDDAGRIINYVGVFSDITKQKAKEEQLRYRSTHDPLTGLANRYLLEQTLEFAILNSMRSKIGIAVLFLDLDGFKLINDTFGHLIGDDLLRDVATVITSSIRESDLATRPGGDEFIIILENLTRVEDAFEVAKKIMTPIELKVDPTFVVTFSIGISFYQGANDVTAQSLIAQADDAMYQAKKSGKNSIRIAG
jgi:diguanylate cyclase (GGDEF)-like protein/PAS domain S-box-containing protein